jgi:hypothetical protein
MYKALYLSPVFPSFSKNKLNNIKHKAPFNTEYMMREMHDAVLHTSTLLFIGQSFS